MKCRRFYLPGKDVTLMQENTTSIVQSECSKNKFCSGFAEINLEQMGPKLGHYECLRVRIPLLLMFCDI